MNKVGSVAAAIFEIYLISVFINEAAKFFSNNESADVLVVVLSLIGIVGIASLIIGLLK